MGLRRKKALRGYLAILPLMAGCIVFYAAPFLLVLWKSMAKGVGRTERFVGLSNYRAVLKSEVFSRAFGNTMRFLAVCLPLILVLSLLIALFLRGQAAKHQRLKTVLLLPYMMPVAGTVMLLELLFAEAGLVNRGLYTLGLPVEDWLHSDAAFWVTVGLYLWKNTGYSVILLLSGLTTIPEELDAAAALDGANWFQRLWSITLPQMWYSFFFATVFSLINAFKCFREIFLVGGSNPHESIYMLQHFINNAFAKMSYAKLAVAAVLLLAVLVVCFALGYRLVLRKEAYKE